MYFIKWSDNCWNQYKCKITIYFVYFLRNNWIIKKKKHLVTGMKICNTYTNTRISVFCECVWPFHCVKPIAQLNYMKNTILKHIVASFGKIIRHIQNYYNTSFQKIVRGSIVGVQDWSGLWFCLASLLYSVSWMNIGSLHLKKIKVSAVTLNLGKSNEFLDWRSWHS